MVFFAVQKLLSLIRSYLLILFLFSSLREVGQKRTCCDLCKIVFFLCFSLKSFMLSGLTYRSLIHFQFIFVCGFREYSNFILLHVLSSFPAPLIEVTVFSPLYNLDSFVIDQLTIGASVYFWAFYSISLIYISVFVPVPYCLDYPSLQHSLNS